MADIKLKVDEKDVRLLLSQPFFIKTEVAIDPKDFNMFHLANLPIIDDKKGGRQIRRAFLLHVISDNVEYNEDIPLVKFLLADRNYLGRGDLHCMAIQTMFKDHNNDIYYCKNSTMKGDGRAFEKIDGSRPDIDLHKLIVNDNSSHHYKDYINEIRSNPSHGKDEKPKVNVHQVNPSKAAQATGLCKENGKLLMANLL